MNEIKRRLSPATFRKEGRIYFGNRELFDFSSNDYLGLSDHPELKEASKKAAEDFGTSSSASRLLSGDLEIHHLLEDKTAVFKGKEKALVFNSGYQANLGIISALYKKGDILIADKLSHRSILDGMLLSGARFFRFLHNDVNHLEHLLQKERRKYKNCLVITETIFSMDGDRAPLGGIAALKEKYGFEIMADEAHATGIFGKNGSGVVEEDGLTDRIDLIMGTFSKALGSFGGYLAGSRKIIEYLVNTCRSFIYSTALPPAIIAANIAALRLVKKEPFRRKKLLENSAYFRNALQKNGFNTRGSSQIVPLIVKNSQKALKLSASLKKKGCHAKAIRPPTVPVGEERIRFSLSFEHDKKVLEKLIECINEVGYV